MGLEVTTALIALVVSLIALIIALLQLIQALFGTAEGYKRCATSVIGHWEGLRYRHFRPTEFRFEVQYITPQILLVSPRTKRWLEEEYNNRLELKQRKMGLDHVYILHEHVVNAKYEQSKEMESQFQTQWWNRNYLSWKNWLSRKVHPWEQKNKMHILHSTVCKKILNVEGKETINAKASDRRNSLPQPKGHVLSDLTAGAQFSAMPGNGQDYEMRVTWDTFLKEICSLYSNYGHHPDSQNPSYLARYTREELYRHASGPIQSSRKLIDDNYVRTDAAIIFREWSWDLMPPDMIRPLATITIGHLVILAVRLGMQWRVLNLESGMSADGHGYSLGGTKSDKLGYVFKLIAMRQNNGTWRLIPNKATDKLICGILPGCPGLVKRDYEFIDNNRKSLLALDRALEPDHILTQIGVPRATRASLTDGISRCGGFPSIHNEIVPLLCTFLPMRDSTTVRHYAHCWLERRQSVFHLWEGRYTLLYYLSKEVDKASGPGSQNALVETFKLFCELKEKFPEDFFGVKDGKAIDKCCNGCPACSAPDHGDVRRRDLIDLCRKIHQRTDKHFRNIGLAHEDEQGRTHYENLVAAHITLATNATLRVTGREKDLPSCPVDDPEIPEQFKEILNGLQTFRPHWLVCRLMALANAYVEGVANGSDDAIALYLTRRGCAASDADLTAAWWMLMLRGVAWDMSTLEHTWGEPIPSSFYDNHLPVWIT